MDIIQTTADLLRFNGSAQSVTVSLTESERRLIAAAPELLAALKAISARIDGRFDDADLMAVGPLTPNVEADCQYIARAAIARARGEDHA